jgi:hypothetical protein
MSGGAGIGATRSRGRRSAEQVPTLWVRPLSRPWRVVRRPMRVTGGHIPRGAPVPPLDAPVFGDATAEARTGTRIGIGAIGPLPGRTYAPRAQAPLRRPRAGAQAADRVG